jgi:UDPglucose 6-dehydrogenase
LGTEVDFFFNPYRFKLGLALKIVRVGTGYVCLSNAMLLAQNNEVIALNVVQKKIDLLSRGQSSIVDNEIEEFLKNKSLNLTATMNKLEVYKMLILF